MIFRQDLKKHWMINPAKKLYCEQPYNEKELQKAVKSLEGKEKILGTEKVNGYKCTKKEVENTVEVMGFSRTSTATVWQSKRFEMPLRTRDEHGGTDMKDIVEKKPNAKLFELPKGYKKVDNMFALFASFDEPEDDASEDDASEDESGAMKMPPGMMEKLKGLSLPFGE